MLHKLKSLFFSSLRELKSPRCLAISALLIALNVAMDLLGIRIWLTPDLRISLGFVLNASIAMLFGPVTGMMAGFCTDVLGYLANPAMGAYFPGYTLTAMLGGLLYGLWLYPCHTTRLRCLAAKASVSLFCNVGLNTLWLTLTGGSAFMALLPLRILKNIVLLPVEVLLLYMVTGIVLNIHQRFTDVVHF